MSIQHGKRITVGRQEITVEYEPDLTVEGSPRWGCVRHEPSRTVIVLRRWDERVFLHEILHLLLGRHYPSGHPEFSGAWVEHPEHEQAIREIEDGLWDLGWRFADGVSHVDPTKPRFPDASGPS